MVLAAKTDQADRPTRILVGITVFQACAYLGNGYAHGMAGYIGGWMVVSGLLVWRLWRGGAGAWAALTALNACVLVICVLVAAGVVDTGQGNGWLALRIAETLAELALLLHPSVRKFVA